MANHPKNRKTKDVEGAFGGPENLHFQRCSDDFKPKVYHNCIALKKMEFLVWRTQPQTLQYCTDIRNVRTYKRTLLKSNFLKRKWEDVMSRIALLLVLQIEGERKMCNVCVCLSVCVCLCGRKKKRVNVCVCLHVCVWVNGIKNNFSYHHAISDYEVVWNERMKGGRISYQKIK